MVTINILILILSAISFADSCNNKKSSGGGTSLGKRVSEKYGEFVKFKDATYMLQIEGPSPSGKKNQYDFKCGGVIIGNDTLLTFWQCVDDKIRIRSGSMTQGSGTVHTYKASQRLNDKIDSLMVVQVNEDFKYRPVVFANKVPVEFNQGRILGWGSNKPITKNKCRELDVVISSSKECQESIDNYAQFPQTPFKTGPALCSIQYQDRTACLRDAGGPLLIGDRLAGIITIALGCDKRFFPTYYSSVVPQKGLIRLALKKLKGNGSKAKGNGTSSKA